MRCGSEVPTSAPGPACIAPDLYEQVRTDALGAHCVVPPGQIEHCAKVGRAVLDNPDLPVSFVAAALASLAEARELATAFVPRSHGR